MAEIIVPELAESISEGTIAKWVKKPGDSVEKGEYIVELETDKVNVEIISDYEGTLIEILKEEGETVQVGDQIAIVDQSDSRPTVSEEKTDSEKKAEPVESMNQDSSEKEQLREETRIASPSARKLAREKGIDMKDVPTSDPLGRLRKHDIESYRKNSKPESQPQPKELNKQTTENKREKRIKLSRRRQTIGKRLVEVQQTAAMLTTFNEVDMTNIIDLRKKRKDTFFNQNDVKLGFMSFFTKAVIGALKKYPLVNAEIQENEIVLKDYYDIGIAVSAEEGLIVPVVRDADRLTFAEIEREIGRLADKAKQNTLSIRELQGGTFTITNGGVFGSLLSTPILNGPQVGILGMHKIQLRPVAIDEEKMENRPMMYIALSYDHRLIDGKEAVSFLVKVKELLEDPEALLLEG